MAFPNFVDTFDAFIGRYLVTPFGSRWAQEVSPRILDTWDRMNIQVRVHDAQGKRVTVPLSAFRVVSDSVVELDEHRLRHSLRYVIANSHEEANRAARSTREQLLRRGFLTCEDARVLALDRVRDRRGKKVVEALAARFRVLVIDEAQDCNPADLEIVQAIQAAGARVVLVADPEQAIYRFRGARPGGLATWSSSAKRFDLTVNFRSTQNICAAASSLKSAPGSDLARGEYSQENAPVLLLPYEKLGMGLGEAFLHRIRERGVDESSAVVLAHQEEHAAAAVGADLVGDSNAKVVRLANAVRVMRSEVAEAADRAQAVEVIEDLICARLQMTPELKADVFRPSGAGAKWLRGEALRILFTLSSRPVVDEGAQKWIEFARAQLGLASPPPWGGGYYRSARQVLRDIGWAPSSRSHVPLAVMTIHKAKGREFDAVLVVVPPTGRTNEMLDAWEQRADAEARSVLYVGATRARRLLAFGVSAAIADRVEDLIARDGAVVERLAAGEIKQSECPSVGRAG